MDILHTTLVCMSSGVRSTVMPASGHSCSEEFARRDRLDKSGNEIWNLFNLQINTPDMITMMTQTEFRVNTVNTVTCSRFIDLGLRIFVEERGWVLAVRKSACNIAYVNIQYTILAISQYINLWGLSGTVVKTYFNRIPGSTKYAYCLLGRGDE